MVVKKKLVIVESPAKARTLGRILGKGYSFMASQGHIRDLPKSRLGVQVDEDFAPVYVVPKDKTKLVNELKAEFKKASTVYLATDPDREGEAISWHLLQIAGDTVPHKRVIFHEITAEAVTAAFKHPRDIDQHLVDAQQARRVLDRLVGYRISPLLWRKVKRGLSAGRVQSVAMKIVVDRQREIDAFKAEEYWTIEVNLTKKQGPEAAFKALLVGQNGAKKSEVNDKEKASLVTRDLEQAEYQVAKVTVKKQARQPAPPFITSTLQQEAWRKLRFSAKQTMVVAQQLYEGLDVGKDGNIGLITYMRTDSTNVARTALAETRDFIAERFGKNYLPPHARTFTSKVKGAQEAHEAIRPTSAAREPVQMKQYLTASQFKLYQLIWQRMLTSQMAAALYDNTTVDIGAQAGGTGSRYALRAQNSTQFFAGFMTLYVESEDEKAKPSGKTLPKLAAGDDLKCLTVVPEQKFTQPPPHYTEASLIRMLEQRGIGRPSTYAAIVSTIQDREYVDKTKGVFTPTELGVLVTKLLEKHFDFIVDVDFSAKMEDLLDEVAQEQRDWVGVVRDYYGPLAASLEKAEEEIPRVKLPDEFTGENCPTCGKPLLIKSGRFGKFQACSGYPDCRYTAPHVVKLGVKCPKCQEGEVLQRVSRRRKVFYGCSRYPDCDFTTNLKPLAIPCPSCGGTLAQYRGNYGRCLACGQRSVLPGTA